MVIARLYLFIKPKGQTLVLFGRTVAKDWQIKKRRPIRRKNIAPLLKDLENVLNIDLNVDGAFLEMAEYGPWQLVLVDRVPLAIELKNSDGERKVFLTLRGFMDYPSDNRYVDVDHGAIPFLMKVQTVWLQEFIRLMKISLRVI